VVVQKNLNANNANNRLGANVLGVKKASEKLSSGYRINRAGDDAAGLAVSEKIRSQVRGLNQAIRNANHGISLIQTAEGGLNETHAILQRMRELAVQSSNGTYMNELDREALQMEVDALKFEINRIAESTEYNKIKLLNGESGGARSNPSLNEFGALFGIRYQSDALEQFVSISSDRDDITIRFTTSASGIGGENAFFSLDGKTLTINLAENQSYTDMQVNALIKSAKVTGNGQQLSVPRVEWKTESGAIAATNYTTQPTVAGKRQSMEMSLRPFKVSNAHGTEGHADQIRFTANQYGSHSNTTGLFAGIRIATDSPAGKESVVIDSPAIHGVRGAEITLHLATGVEYTSQQIENLLRSAGFNYSVEMWNSGKPDGFDTAFFTNVTRHTFNHSGAVNPIVTPFSPMMAPGITPFSTPPTATPARVIDLNALTGTVSGDGWEFSGGMLTITDDGVFQINGTGVATNNRITVQSGVTADVVLNNVVVNTTAGHAFDMHSANVNMWLQGENRMVTTRAGFAGIRTTGGVLEINGDYHTDAIFAQGGASSGTNPPTGAGGAGAGIGGAAGGQTGSIDGGTVIIRGGFIEAHGGPGLGHWSAAGIGGGGGSVAGAGGNVTVFGGVIRAGGSVSAVGESDLRASAIGGGGGQTPGAGGTLTIHGGLVEAVTGHWIGGGRNAGGTFASDGTVTVLGGNLSVPNPSTNIRSGITNNEYRVSVRLFSSPTDAYQFSPFEEVTYTFGGTVINAVADSRGHVFLYLPSGSQSPPNNVGTMTLTNGTTWTGTLATMASDHNDALVFIPTGATFPPPIIHGPWNDIPGDGIAPGIMADGQGLGHDAFFFGGGDGIIFQIGANGTADQRVVLSIDNMSADALGVGEIDVSTREAANISIGVVDSAVKMVSLQRAKLGAMQNRLESTINNLTLSSENQSAAESQIRNTDMAKEMLQYTKYNILQQAAQSMLAQANQAPQGILQLLQ
jgi:flagellin-like hook-associated protein FlgL